MNQTSSGCGTNSTESSEPNGNLGESLGIERECSAAPFSGALMAAGATAVVMGTFVFFSSSNDAHVVMGAFAALLGTVVGAGGWLAHRYRWLAELHPGARVIEVGRQRIHYDQVSGILLDARVNTRTNARQFVVGLAVGKELVPAGSWLSEQKARAVVAQLAAAIGVVQIDRTVGSPVAVAPTQRKASPQGTPSTYRPAPLSGATPVAGDRKRVGMEVTRTGSLTIKWHTPVGLMSAFFMTVFMAALVVVPLAQGMLGFAATLSGVGLLGFYFLALGSGAFELTVNRRELRVRRDRWRTTTASMLLGELVAIRCIDAAAVGPAVEFIGRQHSISASVPTLEDAIWLKRQVDTYLALRPASTSSHALDTQPPAPNDHARWMPKAC